MPFSAFQIDFKKWDNLPLIPKTIWLQKLLRGIVIDNLLPRLGGDVVIHGSYRTGNIGDLTIGNVIKTQIQSIYNKKCIINGNLLTKPNFSKYNTHIIGGGTIYDSYILEKKIKPIDYSKSTIALGISIGPILTNRAKILLKKLEKAELITVRDKISKEKLNSIINNDIKITSCPAFLFENNIAKKEIKNSCGVSLREFHFKLLKESEQKSKKLKFLSFLNRNLKELSKKYDLYFIPFSLEDINFVNKHFRKYFFKILPLKSPENTLSNIKMMEKMICMRFHSMIFSIIAEKPIFTISYADKMKEITNEISNNVDVYNIEGTEIIDFNINKSLIRSIKFKHKQMANQNFELLKNYI